MEALKEIALKNNWELKLISDVVFFQEGPGVRKQQYKTNGVKLLNVTNILDGSLDLDSTDRYISEEEAYGKYSHFLVDEGDLLIACSGIQISYFDKKISFVSSKDLPLCMNTSTMRFKTKDKNKLNIKYFYYFLKSNYFKKQLARQITGSAQLNFGPSHIKKMYVVIPDIDYQIKIINILDRIINLIKIRKEQIQAYDALIDSLFIYMFGNPNEDSNRFNLMSLGDLGKWKSGGTPKRSNKCYFSGDIPWVTSGELNDIFIHESFEHINEDAIENSSAKFVPIGSLLLGMYDSAGLKSSINSSILTTNQAIAFSKLDEDVCNTIFVYFCIQLMRDKLLKKQRGVRQKNFNLSMIKEISIPIPPIEMQNKFADYVVKIEEEKKKLRESLEELETLFDALMQDAFSGNLFKD